jgi:hypothetical protein
MVFRQFVIRAHERGLHFVGDAFVEVLRPGRHFFFDPFDEVRVDIVSVLETELRHPDLDAIADAGALLGEATVVELAPDERALVFVDGALEQVLDAGLYAFWGVGRDVVVEVFDAETALADRASDQSTADTSGAAGIEAQANAQRCAPNGRACGRPRGHTDPGASGLEL